MKRPTTPKPSRAARRKAAAEARKAKAQAHFAIQFEKLDFVNAVIDDDIVDLMKEAHHVVTDFLGDFDEMKEQEPVVIDKVIFLLSQHTAMIGEAADIALVYAATVRPVSKLCQAMEIPAFAGLTSHQLADRFLSVREEVEERMMVVILAIKALEGGYGDATVNSEHCRQNFEEVCGLIGVPRKMAS